MFAQTFLTALVALPVLPVLSSDLKMTADVLFYNQLPPSAYEGSPEVSKYKDQIYVRKDIHYLDPEDGPKLSCPYNGRVKLSFEKESASELHKLANSEILGHPFIIPRGYDLSACPSAANHSILGPREYVPESYLEALEPQDDFLVMIALTEEDVRDNELTFTFDWATYEQLIGVIGEAPEELGWLAKGVYPWEGKGGVTVLERRFVTASVVAGFATLVGGQIVAGAAGAAAGAAVTWGLDQLAGGIRRTFPR